ncbi:hypothetical protein L596_013119 [Steinernema carpocapsae]|uniref:F-box domain-containing protein n=1 Tax=Steinernema carpocapsae TaxID=34508 RepID=A0A4U5NZE9_STECR|nr:hypothetical protein L596_013119 [Steinernema carpocapsae]
MGLTFSSTASVALSDLPEELLITIIKLCDAHTCINVLGLLSKRFRHLMLKYGKKNQLSLDIDKCGTYFVHDFHDYKLINMRYVDLEAFALGLKKIPKFCEFTSVCLVGMEGDFEDMDRIEVVFQQHKSLFKIEELAFHDENCMFEVNYKLVKFFIGFLTVPDFTEIYIKEFVKLLVDRQLTLTGWCKNVNSCEDIDEIRDSLLFTPKLNIKELRLEFRLKELVSEIELVNSVNLFGKALTKTEKLSFKTIEVVPAPNSEFTSNQRAPQFYSVGRLPHFGYSWQSKFELKRAHKFPTVEISPAALGVQEENDFTVEITAKKGLYVRVHNFWSSMLRSVHVLGPNSPTKWSIRHVRECDPLYVTYVDI